MFLLGMWCSLLPCRKEGVFELDSNEASAGKGRFFVILVYMAKQMGGFHTFNSYLNCFAVLFDGEDLVISGNNLERAIVCRNKIRFDCVVL